MAFVPISTFTSGQVLTAAQMNEIGDDIDLIRANQTNVVQSSYTTTNGISNTVASFVDSGLTATITPSLSTSKILVRAQVTVGVSTAMSVNALLLRGATAIAQGAAAGSRTRISGSTFVSGGSNSASIFIEWLDDPATTSPTTYKVQLAPNISGTCYINRSGTDTDNNSHPRGVSVMVLQEIPV